MEQMALDLALLQVCCRLKGSVDILELLLVAGASPNTDRALLSAMRFGCEEAVKLLIEVGVKRQWSS